jgi:hypothetical protein
MGEPTETTNTHRENAYRCPECARRKDAEMPTWLIGTYLGVLVFVAMGLGGAIGRHWPATEPPKTVFDLGSIVPAPHTFYEQYTFLDDHCPPGQKAWAGFSDAGQAIPVCVNEPQESGFVEMRNGRIVPVGNGGAGVVGSSVTIIEGHGYGGTGP